MQPFVDTSGPIRGRGGRSRPWEPQYGDEACVRDSAESLENFLIGHRVHLTLVSHVPPQTYCSNRIQTDLYVSCWFILTQIYTFQRVCDNFLIIP